MYGTASRFNSSFFLSCWMRELILSLRSSSPSPRVIFPLRSRIVTPSTTRSSICIALSSSNSKPTTEGPKRHRRKTVAPRFGRATSDAVQPCAGLERARSCRVSLTKKTRQRTTGFRTVSRNGRCSGLPLPPAGAAHGLDHDVQDRDEDQVQERRHQHPARDRRADGVARLTSGAAREDEREDAEDERQRGHQNRSQPEPRGLDRRLDDTRASYSQLLRKLDNQDRVLC